MGVPVMVLSGDTHFSRVGVSLLSNIGASDLITDSTEDYVEKAIQLANNFNRLISYRSDLRAMIIDSPLMDTDCFTRDLESAYRRMWQRWCNSPKGVRSPMDL